MLFMTATDGGAKSVGKMIYAAGPFIFGSNKRFAGLVFVTSSKAGSGLESQAWSNGEKILAP